MIIDKWEHSKTLKPANGMDGVGKGRRGEKTVYTYIHTLPIFLDLILIYNHNILTSIKIILMIIIRLEAVASLQVVN